MTVMETEWGMARILQPQANFEQRYQGQAGTFPIAFPGTIDAQAAAGVQGFDPQLIGAVPTIAGSRMILKIPMTYAGYTLTQNYQYQIIWRDRTLADYQYSVQQGVNPSDQYKYHLATRELGVPSNPADPTTARFIIPAGMQTIAYEQAEPGGSGANGVINLRGQLINPDGANWAAPLLPAPFPIGTPGIVNQGVFPFPTGGAQQTGGPVYQDFWFDAPGDEIIILAFKTISAAAWDFTGVDRAFSNTYGTDNGTRPPLKTIGMFLLSGSP